MRPFSSSLCSATVFLVMAVQASFVHAQQVRGPRTLEKLMEGASNSTTEPGFAEPEEAVDKQAQAIAWQFKSPAAIKAVKAFEQAERKRLQDSEKQVQDNLTELITSLETSQKEVTQAGDLDEAIRIRDALTALKNGSAQPGAASGKPVLKKHTKIPAKAVAFKGHHYFFVSAPCSWRVACQKCEEVGGHLVTFDSREEYAFVARLRGNSAAYVGATRDTNTGGWEWIDGQPCRDILWATNQPNNGGSEMFLGFQNNDPTGLHDWNVHDKLPFVCEWDE